MYVPCGEPLLFLQPDFWSSVAVKFSGLDVHPHTDLVKIWVERSGSHPLSFLIIGKYTPFRVLRGKTAAPFLFDLFLPHHIRWRKIHLEYRGWGMETGLTRVPDSIAFPHLEDIYVMWVLGVASDELVRVANMIQTASRLQSVS
jgi:hypothetical protein